MTLIIVCILTIVIGYGLAATGMWKMFSYGGELKRSFFFMFYIGGVMGGVGTIVLVALILARIFS